MRSVLHPKLRRDPCPISGVNLGGKKRRTDSHPENVDVAQGHCKEKLDLRPKPVYPRKDLWTLRQTMTQFNNGQQTCQRSPLGPVARLFRSETEEEDHQFGLERSD